MIYKRIRLAYIIIHELLDRMEVKANRRALVHAKN